MSKPEDLEVRFTQPLEVRADEGKPPVVEGYAAVFDQETVIGDYFREVVRSGAFKEAIKRDDVVFLINHEGLPLARSRSGTLEMKEDSKGLWIRSELDENDPDVQRLLPKMQRGDLDKMSFGFWITRQTWNEPDVDDTRELPLREIEEVRLHDVSIVTTPAYEGTEIGVRGLNQYKSLNSVSSDTTRLRMKMKQQQAERA